MRRWLLAVVLSFTAFVVMGSLCKDPYAPYTKIYVANRGDMPFHAGKTKIDAGCSLPILNLQHGDVGYININRNNEVFCMLVVTSLVDVANEEDWEAAIMLTEQPAGSGSFYMTHDRSDLIEVEQKN